jgi:hypothetical protein
VVTFNGCFAQPVSKLAILIRTDDLERRWKRSGVFGHESLR